ncbi:MAG: tetratricopeptide repeat protein [Candidatus Omnitrophica bacterium]|nr:tetratricopeptide repeat protein [Candidatus Omnitrophota bacterium]
MRLFQSRLFPVAIICFLGVIIYSNTFLCSFHLDDNNSILPNLAIRDIHNLRNIWDFWPSRFITYFTLAINYHFQQLDVWGYHFFNLMVHLLSAVLVWYLILLTFSTPTLRREKISDYSKLIAFFTGLIFVASPVQIQGVTYIVQRAVSMATLFYLSSLILYIKFRLIPEGNSVSGPKVFYYAGSLIALVFAMFTKEMTLTLPFMICFYEFSFLKKAKKRINWKRLVPFFLTLFIIPLTMFLTRSVDITQMHRTVEPSPGISPWYYLLTQFRVLVTYIRLVFMPLNQNLDYDYPIIKTLLNLPVLASILFLAIILVFAIRAFRNYRLISFGIFWFFLTLLPESSIIPIKDVIFEHRLYLPMVGFSILLVSGMYYLFKERRIKVMVIVLSLLVVFYSILTYQRNKVWKDEFTLWSDVIHKSPFKARGYNIRGYTYASKGDLDRAITDYNKGIEFDPSLAMSFYNRGNAYQNKGDFDRAISDYNKAIEIDPKYLDAYNNRGNAYQNKGDFDRAISDYNKVIEIDPNFVNAYNNRDIAYRKKSGFNQTTADSGEGIKKGNIPDSAILYNDQGNTYRSNGDFGQAIVNYNKAIEIDSNYALAYNNRGIAYQLQGNSQQAILDYNKVIEMDPNIAITYNNRALIYFEEGKYEECWEDIRKAQALGYNVPFEFIEQVQKAYPK